MANPECGQDRRDSLEVIDLSDESEDEQLRQAIALSLREENIQSTSAEKAKQSSNPKQSFSAGGFLGLDRKQMEEERLARMKRRHEEISPPLSTRRVRSSPKSGESQPFKSSSPRSILDLNSPNSLSLSPKFPTPTVRKTWCFGHPRSDPPNDIKLEELIDRTNLQACILSSFIWDFDWLFSKFETKRTKFLLVMQAKGLEQRQEIEKDWASIPNVRLCFPSMEGQVNCMHSKLMLFFFEKHLRVVVPTANLVPFDWGEDGGVMENTVFLVDLPKRPDMGCHFDRTAFYDDLLYFVSAQGFPNEIVRKLEEFDWITTAKIRFVHSIGGANAGNTWKLTGLCGLGRSVASLGLQTSQKIQLDFVTSSVGSLNEDFMRSIYLAAQGDDGLMEFKFRNASKMPGMVKGKKDIATMEERRNQWEENFRFYFPSDATVKASKGGPSKAGTICFSEKWWNSSRFPRTNMRDCLSRRDGLLMHNKVGHAGLTCFIH